MNYTKHYNLIIKRAKNRTIDEYTEKHHIIPKCLGGNNHPTNIVNLTPEEHYIAHQLLIKIYPDNSSLVFAAAFMVANRNNNKIYGWLKRKRAHAMAICQSGNKNSQYGTCWVSNLSTKQCKKIKKHELGMYTHAGWIKKRIMNFDKFFKKIEDKKNSTYKHPTGKNSASWKGFWITPMGIFETCKVAAQKNNCSIKTIWNRTYNEKFINYKFKPK